MMYIPKCVEKSFGKWRVKMRRVELDYLRVCSMFAVITIHVTSSFIYNESVFAVAQVNLAFFLNQISRFAVPMFIIISGASLELSHHTDQRYSKYIFARLIKVLPPYLLWTAIYFYLSHSHGNTRDTFECLRQVIVSALTGNAAPHLYFIVVICQLYLLFPILRQACHRNITRTIFIVGGITLIIQEVLYFTYFGVNLLPQILRPYMWILFPTWMLYFVFGIVVAEYYDRIVSFCEEHRTEIIGVFLCMSILFTLDSKVTNSMDSSIKPSIILYTGVSFLALFTVSRIIVSFSKINLVVSYLARHSMTTYYCHVLMLNVLRRFNLFAIGMRGMFFLLVCVTISSIIFSIIYDSIFAIVKNKLGLIKNTIGGLL